MGFASSLLHMVIYAASLALYETFLRGLWKAYVEDQGRIYAYSHDLLGWLMVLTVAFFINRGLKHGIRNSPD